MKESGNVGIWGPDGLFHPASYGSCHEGGAGGEAGAGLRRVSPFC